VSDKLRSDSFRWQDTGWDDPLAAWSEFARNLELELLQANERLKRLEEAGDKLTPGAAAVLMWSEIEEWKEAKEAKL